MSRPGESAQQRDTPVLTERGGVRKAAILEAALRVIGDKGLAGLSMRAIATEAGLPLGALGYYFKTKDDLILEAFELHTRREADRVLDTHSGGITGAASTRLMQLPALQAGVTPVRDGWRPARCAPRGHRSGCTGSRGPGAGR